MVRKGANPPDGPHKEAEAGQSKASEAALEVTGQLLMFEPGLYAVTLARTAGVVWGNGFVLPSVRLDPVPPLPGAGRAFAAVLSDGGWLSREGEASFVRAVGGRAGVMLTIYKPRGGVPSPELRIRALSDAGGREVDPRLAPGSPQPPPHEPDSPESAAQLVVAAHVRTVGDVSVPAGSWAGGVGAGHWIEGFSVRGDREQDELQFEYQATLGEQWTTPWFRDGEFCGSRGISLPLLGVRIRLLGTAAERFECRYWGSFVGKAVTGPVSGGQLCEGGGAELEALRVTLVARSPAGTERLASAAEPAPEKRLKPRARRAAVTEDAETAPGKTVRSAKRRPKPG